MKWWEALVQKGRLQIEADIKAAIRQGESDKLLSGVDPSIVFHLGWEGFGGAFATPHRMVAAAIFTLAEAASKLSTALDVAESKLQSARKMESELQGEIVTLRKKLEHDVEAVRRDFAEQRDGYATKYERERALVQQKLADLGHARAALASSEQMRKEEQDTYRASLNSLISQLEAAKSKKSPRITPTEGNLRRTIETQAALILDRKDQVRDLEEDVSSLKRQRRHMAARIKELEGERDELKDEVLKLSAELSAPPVDRSLEEYLPSQPRKPALAGDLLYEALRALGNTKITKEDVQKLLPVGVEVR